MNNTFWDKYQPYIMIGGFFLFFVIIPIIIDTIKAKKYKKENIEYKNIDPADLVKDNKFVTEKRDKYEEIMKRNNAILEPERKQIQTKYAIGAVMTFIPVILFFIFNKIIFLLLLPVFFIFMIILSKNDSDKLFYQKSAKMCDETAESIIKEYDSNLEYYPNEGYKREEYVSLYYGECCDRFYSNDMIINPQTSFCYANVLTESMETDDEGHTYYKTEFNGTLARINIKDVGCTIILGGLAEDAFRKSKEKDIFKMIKLENEEFNQKLLCYSNNELLAYKVLTPNVMEEFINIKKNTIGKIDIRIVHDKLYMRFRDTNGFDNMNESMLESIAVLEEIIKTMDKVKNIIDNKNMD